MQFICRQEVLWVYKTSNSFAAAGYILAEVWYESVIDSYPVVAEYLSLPENIRAMVFMEGEE